MNKFDNDLDIENLPANIYKKVINQLDKNANWKQLVEYVSEKLDFFGPGWIKSLENDKNKSKKTPAENLVDDLSMRMCSVGILCQLLEECNLLESLSILCHVQSLRITIQPNLENGEEKKISMGRNLYLKCKATGLPPPTYTWYHENVVLPNQNQNELTLLINKIDQQGEYRCLISQIDCDGLLLEQIFTNPVSIKINPSPVVIKIQPVPFVEIKIGKRLILTCEAESYPLPKFQWFKDNLQLDNQMTNILTIDKFTMKNEGKYCCSVSNEISQIYTTKSIVVVDLPREKAVAKIALLIANENYQHHETLKSPKHDVIKLASLLEEIGFQVICLLDLNISQMRNAMRFFAAFTTEGIYSLFYFAGHGFKMQESYILATDTPKIFLRSDAICESELLALILPKDPSLLVIILDTCQTLPPKETNPDIYKEIPVVNEYGGRKNLRNLIQAYSTSSYRPSYERSKTDYGLYITHLSKYITEDISVQKVFEQTGKAIDAAFKGKERNQIPIYATNVTKPFRLTDGIYPGETPNIKKLKYLVSFPRKIIDLHFNQSKITCKLMVKQLMKPYLNLITLNISSNDGIISNLYNSITIKQNNLFKNSENNNEYWIHNPQMSKGPLIVSIEKNGSTIGATTFHILNHLPGLLNNL